MADRICSVDDCESSVSARGYCNRHYLRWRKHGDPLGGKPGPAVRRAIDHDDETRTCTVCGERLPIESFDTDANGSGGRRSHCKPCRSAKMKDWYKANQERQRDRQRERYVKWPERIRAQDMERYRRSRAARIELATDVAYRRRARLAEAAPDPTVTRAALRHALGDQCFYCGCAMDFKRRTRDELRPPEAATVEHIVPICQGGGHTWENVVLACWGCNSSKGGRSPQEWGGPRDGYSGPPEGAGQADEEAAALRQADATDLHPTAS